MKKCSKCNELKPESEFSFKNKKIGLLQSQCKKCSRMLIKEHYYNNKDYYLKKAQKRNNILKDKTLSYLIKYLNSHPCVDCNEKDIIVLEFDHINRKNKFKAVSSLVKNRYNLDIIKKEIKKCEVRCANCHRRKTATDFNWLKK